MTGTKNIRISNRYASFTFDIRRNITIVRGDSGTGKTTLFAMVEDYTRNKEKSGVNVSAPCPCVALTDLYWQAQLQDIHESVVFIDEDSSFIHKKEFAEAVRASDNYYILFTREDLHELPYSIEEIYEIKSSGKYHSFKKMYASSFKNGYFHDGAVKVKIDGILTEDAKAGFQFFNAVWAKNGGQCIPAGANTMIFAKLKDNLDKKMLVIADGAAFGAEIDRVLKLEKAGCKLCLYLPESFEWVILRSGLIDDVDQIMENPSDYIASEKWFSWERYFTALLVDRTKDGYLAYSKAKLNKNYLNEREKASIIQVLPDVELD